MWWRFVIRIGWKCESSRIPARGSNVFAVKPMKSLHNAGLQRGTDTGSYVYACVSAHAIVSSDLKKQKKYKSGNNRYTKSQI
jgi:hypothetical protein